jgi:hypothetical protein
MEPNLQSFRDPSGCVFVRDGSIYRSVFAPGAIEFEAVRDAGIYDKLIHAGWLLPHEEVREFDFAPPGTVYCLRQQRLPMITYPWEWPFSLLKDAALLHLNMMEMLISEGFWLRDASAFNVQFDGNHARFIDTLSIGRRIHDSPWPAYRQFCSHFLAPLALGAYRDIRLLSLWRNYLDGFPLDLAGKMLPFRKCARPRLFLHLNMHAWMQRSTARKEKIGETRPFRQPRVSDRGLIGLVRSLKRTIEGIRWKRTSEFWETYGRTRTYEAEDVGQKSSFVDNAVKKLEPQMVWDLGANTGEFSFVAAAYGACVVSIDGDPACTEFIYQKAVRQGGRGRLIPLTMDLANPSPGLGWRGRERPGLGDRGPADLVLALALVHHLVFTSGIPLMLIAEWLADLAEHSLVEFIPPSDPMVLSLLRARGDDHLPYNSDIFLSSFGKVFDMVAQIALKNGRQLFFYRRKQL